MTQEEWRLSVTHLRTLLGELEAQGSTAGRNIKYKFALEYNPMFGYYHIWNGKSKNTVCTIRINSKKVIVRYRPNSYYRYEIRKINFPTKEMVFVPSDTLNKHRRWVKHQVQSEVDREIDKVNNFLDQLKQRFPTPNQSSGQVILSIPHMDFTFRSTQFPEYDSLKITRISFPDDSTLASYRFIIDRIIRELHDIGYSLRDGVINYREILMLAERYLNIQNPFWSSSIVNASTTDSTTTRRVEELPF